RDAHGVADTTHGLERLGEREDVGVGHRLDRGDAEAARPDGVEAGLFRELRGERVVRARGEENPGPMHCPEANVTHPRKVMRIPARLAWFKDSCSCERNVVTWKSSVARVVGLAIDAVLTARSMAAGWVAGGEVLGVAPFARACRTQGGMRCERFF